MLVSAVVCLPCMVHIWRQCGIIALRQVMCSAVLMIAVHGLLLLDGGATGHSHSAGAPSGAGTSTAAGLLAVIGLEITTAWLAATLVARLRPR